MGTPFHVMKNKNNVQDGIPAILMRTGNHRQRMKEIGGMEGVLSVGVSVRWCNSLGSCKILSVTNIIFFITWLENVASPLCYKDTANQSLTLVCEPRGHHLWRRKQVTLYTQSTGTLGMNSTVCNCKQIFSIVYQLPCLRCFLTSVGGLKY